MYNLLTLNKIAACGLNNFDKANYNITDNCENPDCIILRSFNMHDMELADSLMAVARAGAGVNNIPIDKCSEKGIVVFNTPGANANGVKELVILGMLLAARDVVGGIEWVKSDVGDDNIAKVAEKEKKKFAGTELFGKKLGVIGLGAIGVKVANLARHFGMEVMGYDPYVSVNAAWSLNKEVRHAFNVDDIYAQCDYITIHVPLMESTKGYIGKEAIDKMKDGVVILNFARDLLVNEAEVIEAIKAGKVHRYVTDFPNPTTAGVDGCIVIPHLGASTEESEDNCAKMAVLELMDYLENGNIKNSVNYPACDMGVCTKVGRIAIYHKNIANMITQFTAELGGKGINISDLTNKSKGDVAYTMMDVEAHVPADIIEALEKIEGVFRVRVVK